MIRQMVKANRARPEKLKAAINELNKLKSDLAGENLALIIIPCDSKLYWHKTDQAEKLGEVKHKV